MLVAFSQLPDSRNLCRSAIMDLAALGTSSSSISTQAPALLLMLFHDGPVLPAEVWMPLLPLLDYLSQFSEQAVELGTRLRSLAGGGFWTAPRLGGQMASPPNGQMQAQLATFQTAPGATWSQCEQTKLESINVTKHTVKGGRRNTRHATQLRQNKCRGHKAACNRSQHKQSFTHYPNRHQKQ